MPALDANLNKKFYQIRSFIRDLEAEEKIAAASIKQEGDFIEISYDKDAFFECAHEIVRIRLM